MISFLLAYPLGNNDEIAPKQQQSSYIIISDTVNPGEHWYDVNLLNMFWLKKGKLYLRSAYYMLDSPPSNHCGITVSIDGIPGLFETFSNKAGNTSACFLLYHDKVYKKEKELTSGINIIPSSFRIYFNDLITGEPIDTIARFGLELMIKEYI